MKEQIKGFFGITMGVILGSEAIRQIGSAGLWLGEGIKSSSQSLVGIGVLGNTIRNTKDMFKLK